jgi:poly(3-hydroxybutyrate) depolymerase
MERNPALRLALAFTCLLGFAACSSSGGAGAIAPPAPPVLQPLGSPAATVPQGAKRSSEPGSSMAASPTPAPAGVVPLGTYGIDPAKVFVAGISSGGFFAVQMQVAHSATIRGAAIYAGGTYYCALDNVVTALTFCGGEGLYQNNLAASEAYLDTQSSLGTIDDKSHLAGKPVYLWSGTHDTVVDPREMNDLASEYQHYGANIVQYDNLFPAGHGWESPNGELACGQQQSPYVLACTKNGVPYDSEAVWLRAFLGNLHRRNDGTPRGALVHFDQAAFGASASNSMDTNGWAYVPNGCSGRSDRCALVVAFHGCLQTQADIGTKFVMESGINQWADTNKIVVLYPFAVKSTAPVVNPNGCWDWWGYDDPNYATKSGTQISIIYKMIQHMIGS